MKNLTNGHNSGKDLPKNAIRQKGTKMKFRSIGLIVLPVVLTLGLYACATDGRKTGSTQELLTAHEDHDPKNLCKWKFNRDPNQKNKVSGPIVLETNTGGVCKVEPPSNQFYIGTTPNSVKRVRDMDAKDFQLEGSCLYCYPNTLGGMSCVNYPC